jgi:hypothetical protein
MRSPVSALLTASTEIARLTPSGDTVSGSTTTPRNGMTGRSLGSAGGWEASDMWLFRQCSVFLLAFPYRPRAGEFDHPWVVNRRLEPQRQ